MYYQNCNYKYVVQHRATGQVIDFCLTLEQAQRASNGQFDIISIEGSSSIEVVYIELGGPNGYGHSEPSFTTYGGITRCFTNLVKWAQEVTRVFGPDPREIKDHFNHCHLYINGKDKTEWFRNQVDKIDLKKLFI